jgi:hypothetical protein
VRAADAAQVLAPLLSAITFGFQEGDWLPALVVLAVGALLSLLVWDVRRAGGLAKWRQEMAGARVSSSRARTKRVRERLKRRRLKRRSEAKRRKDRRDGG